MIRDALNELMQTEQVREQVTDQVERLMSALGGETLFTKELLERLGLKHRPTFSNNYLRPALELGLIEMTVPDKPNSSKQQYRAVKRNSGVMNMYSVKQSMQGLKGAKLRES